MKFLLLLLSVACFGSVAPAVISPPTLPPPTTLAQDLEELQRLIPIRPLRDLITRYLLNDPEFQALVRTINTPEAFALRSRILAQPEVIAFVSNLRQRLASEGASIELEESGELLLLNPNPYWSHTVFGLNGFIGEVLAYAPLDILRAHIVTKRQQSPAFAQFLDQILALRPVWERIWSFPETQQFVAALEGNGVELQPLIEGASVQLNSLIAAASPPVPATPVVPPVVEPAVPVEPVELVAPVEPVEPAAPVEPVEPVAPVEPVEPVAPVEPVEPAAPVEPVEPAAPVEPVEPAAPVEPVEPIVV